MASKIPFERWGVGLRRRVWVRPACAVAIWFCTLSSGVWSQTKPSEYDVKAAYLFNFGKFMRIAGTAQAQRPDFDICILGRDPIGHVLDAIVANESIDHRPVRVARLTDPDRGRRCDIVFISPYEGEGIRADLAALAGTDVLTVSDSPDFLERGGMIQFVLQDDHVRFEVNLNAVDRTHLVLSSELLRVAAAVMGKPAEGLQ
jgi:YfiR/HmsC-like